MAGSIPLNPGDLVQVRDGADLILAGNVDADVDAEVVLRLENFAGKLTLPDFVI